MTTPPVLTPVKSDELPAPVGPYSPGVIVGNLVFVSGQAGRDPKTGQLAADVEAQTEQTLTNVAAILEAAGSSLSHVVRCGVFLVDMSEFQKMNAVYSRMFGDAQAGAHDGRGVSAARRRPARRDRLRRGPREVGEPPSVGGYGVNGITTEERSNGVRVCWHAGPVGPA